jgi:hypothetical protein
MADGCGHCGVALRGAREGFAVSREVKSGKELKRTRTTNVSREK